MVTDGRGGVWFGPWLHWTGHAWINTSVYPYGPTWLAKYGGLVQAMARIPGTGTVLAGGILIHEQPVRVYALLMSFGKMP